MSYFRSGRCLCPDVYKPPHNSRQYKFTRMQNGMEVLLVSVPGSRISAASLTVAAGSYQDPDNQQGLAHYLEHMIMTSSTRYSEHNTFMNFVKKYSGESNAYTSTDRTSYHFSIDGEHFENALDIFASNIESPLLDQMYSSKELTAVNEEWALRRGNSYFIEKRVLATIANIKHPLKKLLTGNSKTLSNKDGSVLNDELLKFYKKHYVANNMKLVLVGDVSVEILEDYATHYFSSFENHNVAKKPLKVEAFTIESLSKQIHIGVPQSQSRLQIAIPITESVNDWKYKPADYLLQLLNSKEEGTLVDRLRKDGLAREVGFLINAKENVNGGFFRADIELTVEGLKKQDLIIAMLLRYLGKIKLKGVVAERARIFQQSISRQLRNYRGYGASRTAQVLSSDMLDYPFENIVNHDFIYEYSPESVLALLNQLTPDRIILINVEQGGIGGKKIAHAKGDFRITTVSDERKRTWESLSPEIMLPPLFPINKDKKDIIKPQYLKTPKMIVNEKGVFAWLMHPCCSRSVNGRIDIEINSALPSKTVRNFVGAHIINNIYKKKTQAYLERIKKITGIWVSNSNNLQANTVISVAGNTKFYSEIILALMADFVSLEFTEQQIQTEIKPYIHSMNSIKKKGVRGYEDLIARNSLELFPWVWTEQERLQGLQALTLSYIRDLHKKLITDSALRIFALGNFSEKDIEEFAKRAKSNFLNKDSAKLFFYQSKQKPIKGAVRNLKRNIDSSGVAFSVKYWLPDESDTKFDQLVLLEKLYAAPFFTNLRTKNELSYELSARAALISGYPAFMIVIESNNTGTGKLNIHLEQFNKEFVTVLNDLSDEEFEEVKLNYLKDITILKNLWMEYDIYSKQLKEGSRMSIQERVYGILNTSRKDLIQLYQGLILGNEGEKIYVQVRGTDMKDEPFMD